ncbi:DUF3348 domain-containing protein [Thauera sp.]|jgi:hypothetical protein|uniref:DUF3348 domain-containing protein n=1 Tax=Thauera sp. TaxID=1905334 RepID=UPI002A35DB8A|nr:DUF3348 domain-containing protein [Thauera sp.]MDX9886014.1 DUF3348 domain-containing protein [Thauera sp.]
MRQAVSWTRFDSAGLVRILAELAVADVADAKQTFAERLGEWLDLKDALALYSALNSAAGNSPPRAPPAAALRAQLAQVRGDLAAAVAAAGTAQPGGANLGLPTPLPNAAPESAADFAPFHRYYLAHQRAMATAVGPLRASVRAALSAQSAAFKQLAALDAVMEQAFAAREASLLATVPVLLGRRFAHLFETHQRGREAAQPDDPAQWMQSGGWLARFCAELQRVLLAELDLRLMPVAGLVAALDKESTEIQ